MDDDIGDVEDIVLDAALQGFLARAFKLQPDGMSSLKFGFETVDFYQHARLRQYHAVLHTTMMHYGEDAVPDEVARQAMCRADAFNMIYEKLPKGELAQLVFSADPALSRFAALAVQWITSRSDHWPQRTLLYDQPDEELALEGLASDSVPETQALSAAILAVRKQAEQDRASSPSCITEC